DGHARSMEEPARLSKSKRRAAPDRRNTRGRSGVVSVAAPPRASRSGVRAKERGHVIGLVVLAALAFAGFVVVGTLVAAGSVVLWGLTLPFRLLGFLFRGGGFLTALPFLVVGALIAAIGVGIGALFLFVPIVPLILLSCSVGWLVG